ncbi:aminopeptidase P family protein [Thalassotalea sp. M1531]|uniref:Aminopeptidase P family protein n=1 Tax=Thalassotalea algicola TaxID=2716224 RepID=A0A7Y0LAG5_9GAMM|nr:M24 family metallopeptidase [Thalassotalea algicola]NMP30958.1 aminopeptidase P family protein [Thalassotalea algicola]
MKHVSYFLLICCIGLPAIADDWQPLPLRERAILIDQIMEKRIEHLMPSIMEQTKLDMWILISREYNEDPVLKTLLPSTWLSARRRTILVIVNDEQQGIKTYAVAPYKVGNQFVKSWDKKQQPNQWRALTALIDKYQPSTIGLNESKHWAHADGLVATDKKEFLHHLPDKYKSRLVSAESAAVSWLEQRIPEEITIYKPLVAKAHRIIAEAFSSKVITPGVTTTDDVVWWLREQVINLKLNTWFHPSVSLQRSNAVKFDHENSFTNGYGNQVIQQGDLLHVDFGLSYLRLHTDTQQHAYVLKDGESDAPLYLKKAFAMGNQLQDIFTKEFKVGRTGNEVLEISRQKAIDANLKPTIYTHPLGYHGHAAGTTLGMWDKQDGVKGSGDYPLHINTAYSIELNNAVTIPEWKKEVRIMLEEDAFFDKSGVWYLSGRQEELLLIK